MYLIVVGAGQIGLPLLRMATIDGHEVVAIERDPERADKAAQEFDCLVLKADATTQDALDEAGIAEADALIAVTDDDAINIMICLLAKDAEVPNIVSIVRDSAHMGIFRQIGVEILENPQRLVAAHLYQAVYVPSISDYISLSTGAEVFEIEVADDAPITGMSLAEASTKGVMSKDLLVVALTRADAGATIARGDTRIEAGDRLVVYAAAGVDHSIIGGAFGSV